MNSRVSTPTTAHRRHHTPKPEASSEAALKQALRREVRKRKDAEKHLEIATQFDDLTGLANRNLALRRLEQATEKARLEGGKAALLYLCLLYTSPSPRDS